MTFVEFNPRLSNIQTSLILRSARHNFRIVPWPPWFPKLGWRVNLERLLLLMLRVQKYKEKSESPNNSKRKVILAPSLSLPSPFQRPCNTKHQTVNKDCRTRFCVKMKKSKEIIPQKSRGVFNQSSCITTPGIESIKAVMDFTILYRSPLGSM